MTDLIEQVAAAIYGQFPFEKGTHRIDSRVVKRGRPMTWAEFTKECPLIAEMRRDTARTAIAAMREPTEAMKVAAANSGFLCHPSIACAHDAWEVMIDAALNETGGDS